MNTFISGQRVALPVYLQSFSKFARRGNLFFHIHGLFELCIAFFNMWLHVLIKIRSNNSLEQDKLLPPIFFVAPYVMQRVFFFPGYYRKNRR